MAEPGQVRDREPDADRVVGGHRRELEVVDPPVHQHHPHALGVQPDQQRVLQRAVATMSPSTWRDRSDSICASSRAGSLSVLTIKALYPAGASTSSMPRTIGGNSGLVRSGMTSPTVVSARS